MIAHLYFILHNKGGLRLILRGVAVPEALVRGAQGSVGIVLPANSVMNILGLYREGGKQRQADQEEQGLEDEEPLRHCHGRRYFFLLRFLTCRKRDEVSESAIRWTVWATALKFTALAQCRVLPFPGGFPLTSSS